jgi:two-component system response regulator DesR
MTDGNEISMAKRILIVDDKEHVRQDLHTVLALSDEIEILGEAANGQEAIRLSEVLQPDVILLDLEMPGIDGYEVASAIKSHSPSCRVIVLTVHGYPAAKHKAIRAGADSFIVKGTPVEQLIQAILGEFDFVEEDL